MVSCVKIAEALAFRPNPDMLERYCLGTIFFPPSGKLAWAMWRFNELKKYLVVLAVLKVGNSGARCPPPLEVDLMWHHFISDDTRAYMDYCNTYLGGYIHHRAGGQEGSDFFQGDFMALAASLGIKLDSTLWKPDPSEYAQCG